MRLTEGQRKESMIASAFSTTKAAFSALVQTPL
jgi:hypothetical protein